MTPKGFMVYGPYTIFILGFEEGMAYGYNFRDHLVLKGLQTTCRIMPYCFLEYPTF